MDIENTVWRNRSNKTGGVNCELHACKNIFTQKILIKDIGMTDSRGGMGHRGTRKEIGS